MSTRPNILLVFTDQQRADTVGALGNPVIRTPSLDRLCREGVSFTSAYTASPVCVSARCSLMYGRYPMNTGCSENRDRMPTDGRPSFVDLLAADGYRTHAIGKCHFTPDPHALRGFQSRERQEELSTAAHDEYMRDLAEAGLGNIPDPNGVRGEMYYVPQVSQLPAARHPTQWIGDRAEAFIRGSASAGSPWMLFCSFIHPHPPFAPPSPWHKLYRAPLMPLPKWPQQCEALQTYINRFQNRYKYRDQGMDLNLLRCMKAHYYACVSFLDYQVGRLLDSLDSTGQAQNTLVVFTSDHGELLGDYRSFGKRSMHDASARIPLIARLPGRLAGGRRCATPSSLVDVAPTVLGAAGVDAAALAPDGLDLEGVASGTAAREMVFSQHDRGGDATYMALTSRWKYFYSAPDDREFLFDRVQDPDETRNRAGLSLCRRPLEAMRNALIAEIAKTPEAPSALDGERWRRYPRRALPDDPDEGLLIQDPPGMRIGVPGYADAMA